MPTCALPDDPDLGQLRSQARELQRALRAGDPDAVALAAEFDAPTDTRLSTAQLVVARRHGFPSWPALVRYLGVVAEHRRAPEAAPESDEPAIEFLRRGCLTYSASDGEQQRTAAEVLAEFPDLARNDVWVAAARADVESLRRLLAADPASATRLGGPHRWPPITYLAYARHAPAPTRNAVLAAATVLLEHGADPDTGFLWHGMPSPFTLLTGAFGEGEQGPDKQPRHPHGHALARLLLEHGADPNDAQGLYNRMFRPDDDHLELLFEFGLGTGDGGPWRRRLGERAMSPGQLLRWQLGWAVTHGFTHRVELLADHGVELTDPLDGFGVRNATPHQAAVRSGQFEVARLLEQRGAGGPLSSVDRLLAAVLAGDPSARSVAPEVLERTRAHRPGLVVWAAALGSRDAVRLAVELGWDVSAKGRTDTPDNAEWETALHHAAAGGDAELARLLLELGADPDVRDHRFDATPRDWAHHFGRPALVELLEQHRRESRRSVSTLPASDPARPGPGG